MTPKGVQNLEVALATCQNILEHHDIDPDWQQVLTSIISVGQDLKTKFFLKTNLAIPATSACRKYALELEEVAADAEASRFAEALDRLKSSVEEVLKGADMRGIIIT